MRRTRAACVAPRSADLQVGTPFKGSRPGDRESDSLVSTPPTGEKNAVPDMSCVQEVDGITEFGRRGAFVFGNCDKGYFLLDTDRNELTISRREDWVTQLTARTGSPPGDMKNPKSWLVQTRPPFYHWIMGGFVAITLPLAFAPLWSTHRKGKPIKGSSGVGV